MPVPGNLLTGDNESFEASAGGWFVETNCSIARVTTQALDGTASLAITATAAGGTAADSPGVGVGVVVPGRRYLSYAWMRTTLSGITATVSLNWYSASAYQATTTSPSVTLVANQWTWVGGVMTAPNPSDDTLMKAGPVATGAAQVFNVDRAFIGLALAPIVMVDQAVNRAAFW